MPTSKWNSVLLCHRLAGVLFVAVILLMWTGEARAINFGSLVRTLGRVADDVPLNKVDDVAEELAKSKAGREVLKKAGVRIDDALERSRGLSRLLRETVGESNPAILKQLDALDEPAREAALVLARGARRIDEAIPDVALRSQFLREGGAETVAALGRHPDFVDDVLEFDVALRAGRLPSPAGMRAATLEDLGHFLHVGGDRARHFWSNSVRPHWKLWLGGSALTAVLITPDEYLDAVGDLTEAGLEKLGKFGGDLLAKALRGAVTGLGEGSKKVVQESAETVTRVFLTEVWGVVTLTLMVLVIAFLTRRKWSRFKAWFKVPKP